MSQQIINVAAYMFVSLDNLPTRKLSFVAKCRELDLKGTVLLSTEGINLFVAGLPAACDSFLIWLRIQPEFATIEAKLSPSDDQPFTRMMVRIKKEIIPLGNSEIFPAVQTSRKIKPNELKTLLDEKRDVILLDVRNDYEVVLGTFESAVPAKIDHFRDFEASIHSFPKDWKKRPIVMFCTGGIRCEKAGPLMERAGYKNVAQLDGGILKYFEDCGGAHYRGDCFVFDKRVAVDPNLVETTAGLCFACQTVLSEADQQSDKYIVGRSCPHCYQSHEQSMNQLLQQRATALKTIANPLPGSMPRDNIRPMNIPAKFDRSSTIEMLTTWHDHLPNQYWIDECALGRICRDGHPLTADSVVRAGMRIEHLISQVVEPDVNAEVRWIFEDNYIVVVNKPAPLPVHPCGRFNRNTLIHMLDQVYGQQRLRPAHRLDANTTGVTVFSRTREVARRLQPLFEQGKVEKVYLTKVMGLPSAAEFECDAPIARQPHRSGSRLIENDGGLAAKTHFRLIKNVDDQHSLLECRPITGRTNQIRAHLAHLGLSIVGDVVYQQDSDSRSRTELVPTATIKLGDPPLCLHAWKISFPHPYNNTPLNFTAPLPSWYSPLR